MKWADEKNSGNATNGGSCQRLELERMKHLTTALNSQGFNSVQETFHDLRAQNCWKTRRMCISMSLVKTNDSNVWMYLKTCSWCCKADKELLKVFFQRLRARERVYSPWGKLAAAFRSPIYTKECCGLCFLPHTWPNGWSIWWWISVVTKAGDAVQRSMRRESRGRTWKTMRKRFFCSLWASSRRSSILSIISSVGTSSSSSYSKPSRAY